MRLKIKKRVKIFSIILSAYLLSGCATFDGYQPQIHQPPFKAVGDRKIAVFNKFIVIENPGIKSDGLARWDWGRKICIIELKKYPECLLHEIYHCFEGYWHGEEINGEYCD